MSKDRIIDLGDAFRSLYTEKADGVKRVVLVKYDGARQLARDTVAAVRKTAEQTK